MAMTEQMIATLWLGPILLLSAAIGAFVGWITSRGRPVSFRLFLTLDGLCVAPLIVGMWICTHYFLLAGLLDGVADCAGTGVMFIAINSSAMILLQADWKRPQLGSLLKTYGLPIIVAAELMALRFYVDSVPTDLTGWQRCAEQSGSHLVVAGFNERIYIHDPNSKSTRCLESGNHGDAWRDLAYPGEPSFTQIVSQRGELWLAGTTGDTFHSYSDGRWRSVPRPAGYLDSFTVVDNQIFAAYSGRVIFGETGKEDWLVVNDAHRITAISSGKGPDGQMTVFAAGGAEWVQSTDRGLTWQSLPSPETSLKKLVAVGGGGWRYVVQEGSIYARFWVAAPGASFVERSLPGKLVRIVVADSADGHRLVIGTWGQGVYCSEDGGSSWSYLGLRRVKTDSLFVNFSDRTIFAAPQGDLEGLLWRRF